MAMTGSGTSTTNKRRGASFLHAAALAVAVTCASALALPVDHQVLAASRIVTVVNNVPITSNDIARRVAFFKLRRIGGNLNQKAKEELIEEQLKMQEARRLRAVASDRQVDEAYANFAKRNRMPQKALRQILGRSGVTVRGFKEYIRAQISWQQAVALRARSQARPQKATNPLDHLHGKRDSAGRTTEYTIQQIVFVVPRGSSDGRANARMREAQNFRSRFPGCEGSVAYAANLRDVSVRKRGRIQAHELPPFWRDELDKISPGKATKPLKTDLGVEMLALCRKREVLSKVDATGDDGELFSGTQQEMTALEKKYLEELRKTAVIKDR